MYSLIIAVFVLGYVGIVLEHTIKINKTAIAIVTGILCWTLFMFSTPSDVLLQSIDFKKFTNVFNEESKAIGSLSAAELHREFVNFSLAEHLSQISQILFFLLGAMTIVELVDAHHGFKPITDRVKTKKSSCSIVGSLLDYILPFLHIRQLDNNHSDGVSHSKTCARERIKIFCFVVRK